MTTLARWAVVAGPTVSDTPSMSARAQVLVALITVVSILFILRLVRRRQLRGKYGLLWIGVGLLLGAFAVYPDVLVPVSDWVGISYEPATFFLAAIAFLFLVIVHFSWELSRMEEQTRSLAEELALLRERLASGPGGSDREGAPDDSDAA